MCQVEKAWTYNMQNMDIQSMHMQSKVHGQALVFRVSMYVLWVSAHCIKFLYRKNIYKSTLLTLLRSGGSLIHLMVFKTST